MLEGAQNLDGQTQFTFFWGGDLIDRGEPVAVCSQNGQKT